MDLKDSSGVKQNPESPELARNTSIAVTIDDLAEGLLVVSFTHSDNLYQGVLFQLNRERGIPSGISFAKEHALGNSTADKADSDLALASLHQRHTYNQGISNGPSPIGTTISQPSLRRVIKPPARFKNARMSLRLRARPVLCAKCRSLCDDKGDPSSKDDSHKDDTQTEKGKKERPKLTKSVVTTSTTSASSSFNGKLKGAVPTANPSAADPKDLCYVSVRNKRVVENFWKRPLVQPLIPSTEETYAKLRKHKAPPLDNRERKRVKVASATTSNCSNCITTTNSNTDAGTSNGTTTAALSTSHHEKGMEKVFGNDSTAHAFQDGVHSNATFVAESTVCDKNFPNTRSRKAQNLKMCISKLTEMKSGRGETTLEDSTWSSTVIDTNENSNNNFSSPNHSDSSESATTTAPSPTSTNVVKSKIESGLKSRSSTRKSKEWENRMRKKSTVPVRYRDQSYLTKNIFNFNKRRPLDGGDIPVLTICRSDAAKTFVVSGSTEHSDANAVTTTNVDDDEANLTPSSDLARSVSPAPEEEQPALESYEGSSSRPVSPTSSSPTIAELQPKPSLNDSITKPSYSKPMEMTKTPTIKITFGSSGNGMVVQIPPKVTQHVECSSTTEMKAARKAMKKAKKEARRKRSSSADFSPSYTALSPDHAPKPDRSNPPSPLTSEPMSSVPILENEADAEPCEPVPSKPVPSIRVTKRKKKQKKRRRSSKVLKENDGFTSSSSSYDHGGFHMSSPCSNSSLNQDFANHGHSSPGATSVKSCNLDSISNPDVNESFPSFGKDACPPSRRRSVPATSTTSSADVPQRVCINLKRIDTNAYVPLPLHAISTQSDHEDPSSMENNGVDGDEPELSEFPINGASNGSESEAISSTAESLDYYKDKETECTYRKGDIVWGKLPACPWWPGKIADILTANSEGVRAKISWYKSTTQSCIRFKMVLPFADNFDSKYTRSRRRGLYQLAVRDALVETHKLEPVDLQTTD